MMTDTADTGRMKVCLSIAGLDPSGGAGIIADLKAFAAFGCYGAAAVTSITFQNTMGVFGAAAESAASVRGQVDPVLDDIGVDALKTGMLPTRGVIEEVAATVRDGELRNFVVDPVVRATSGFDLIDDAALSALTDLLFPLSDLVTPNLPEAERIAGMKIDSPAAVREAARIMRSMGARNVLIKGGHSGFRPEKGAGGARTADDYLFLGEAESVISGEYFETTATHGTGCTLSAAIAAGLALGEPLEAAVRTAKRYVAEAIRTAPMLGKGHSPVNHFARIE